MCSVTGNKLTDMFYLALCLQCHNSVTRSVCECVLCVCVCCVHAGVHACVGFVGCVRSFMMFGHFEDYICDSLC